MNKKIFLLAFLGIFLFSLVSATTWTSDAQIIDGLPDVGASSSANVFNFSDDWYLITGNESGLFGGYTLAANGTTWLHNSTIASGLNATGTKANSDFIQIGNNYYLITCGNNLMYGWTWGGSSWVYNSTIQDGIALEATNCYINLFNKDESSFAIVGNFAGTYSGYVLAANKTSWVKNATIIGGLPDVGNFASSNYILINGTEYLLLGQCGAGCAGTNGLEGYTWTGTAWASNLTANDSIIGTDSLMVPSSVQIGNYLYEIIGRDDGTFDGYSTFNPLSTPIVTLNSPADYTNSTNPAVTFNATITTSLGDLTSSTLFINNVGNETNSSGIEGIYIFDKILAEGSYIWNVQGCNSAGCVNETARNLTIDYTSPSISITSPSSPQNYLKSNSNMTLNFTTTDPNLEACIWEYNGANTSVPCSNAVLKTYYFNYSVGINSGVVYANDTSGNTNSQAVSWNVNILENSRTFSATTYETATEAYSLNITLSSGVSLTSASLNWNGTSYGSNIYSSGNNRIINNSLVIPATNASYNATLIWVLTTNSSSVNTTSSSQVINTLKIDDCSVNANVILNYTIYDEDTRLKLNSTLLNTSSNLYVQISGDLSGNLYNYYSGTLTNNSITICADNSIVAGNNYRLDALIQYTASDYVTEYNYIQNYTLNSSVAPNNVSLYLLASNNSQEFLITYKDVNLLPVEGAIIELSRQYPELGPNVALSVENMKTDSDGKTIGHFVLNDIVYNIYVRVNGVLKATYLNQRAFCSNLATGDCQINLNEKSSTTNPQSYTNYLNVIGTESYNDTSKVYTFDFTTTDSSTKTINLTLYKVNNTDYSEVICSSALTSSSGTLICSIPAAYYNSTALVKILVDGSVYTSHLLSVAPSYADTLTAGRFILAFILIIMLPLMALGSGPLTLVMFIIGIIAAAGFALLDVGGFIGPASAFLWIIIGAIILLIKASSRRQQ